MADAYQTKIQCAGCRKHLMKLRFSQTSVTKYEVSVVKNRRSPQTPIKLPRCLNCNPGNRNEMTCIMCNQTKGLDDFSKAQRKKSDDAHCKDCQQEKDDREPDHNEEVKEVEIMEEYARNKARWGSHVPSTASRLSQAHRTASDRDETDTNPGSESWRPGNDRISLTGSAYSDTSNNVRQNTGTDWDNSSGDINRDRDSSSNVSRRTGFVKQPAVPKDIHQKIHEQLQRDERRTQEEPDLRRAESDNEEDDGDDSDPY